MEDFAISDESFLHRLRSDPDYATHVLCSHYVGWSFMRLQLLEEFTGMLTHICDEKRVKIKFGKRDVEWFEAGKRLDAISRSTFGTVVSLLVSAGIRERDAAYLRSIVQLRNEFVHKLSKIVPFPGDFEKFGFPRSEYMKRVYYYGKRFNRAERYLPKILADAGLIVRKSFGPDGWGISNPNIFDHLQLRDDEP